MERFAFLDHPRPLAFAHRGATTAADENTMAAFEAAARLGYRYIESDVQVSRDGVPILFHDETLERMTGAPGRVSDHDWHALARMRTPRGSALVPVADALAAFPAIRFNLDPKSDAAVDPLGGAIARCGAVERVCIGSFDVRRTLRLRRRLGPRLCWSPSRRGVTALWLAGWGVPVPRLAFPAVQVPATAGRVDVVTPRFVAEAHRRGIQVHVWTIDAPADMERLLDLGVDGLMTDNAGVLRQVLQRRGPWPA